MKRLFMTMALFGLLLIPAQNAFAWCPSQLNPLPYVGIGQNSSSFSLNPFTGFRNCNPCKAKKVECNPCKVKKAKCDPCEAKKAKCDPCERKQAMAKPCSKCAKTFPDKPCPCNKY